MSTPTRRRLHPQLDSDADSDADSNTDADADVDADVDVNADSTTTRCYLLFLPIFLHQTLLSSSSQFSKITSQISIYPSRNAETADFLRLRLCLPL